MDFVPTMKSYRLELSDGEEFSDQVLLYSNLTKQAEELTDTTYPIIEIYEYDLLNKKHVAIVAYKFVSSHPLPIGNPDSIESSFFTKLQEGHPNLIWTPSRMRGELKRTRRTANLRKRVLADSVASGSVPTKRRRI